MSRTYDYFLEKKEEEIINNDPVEGLISHFDLSVETETGNDGTPYQNYIEFPTFGSYSNDDINEVIDIFNIDFQIDLDEFPFEEEVENSIYVQAYLSSLPEMIYELCAYDEEQEIVIFPNEDQVRDEIENIFEENSVPFGFQDEYTMPEFPERHKLYSQSDYDDDFFLYDIAYYEDNNSIENYVSKISNIINSYNNTNDSLIKKSLVLAAFSTNEAFIRSKIISKMPDTSNITEDNYISLVIKKDIQKQLSNYEMRKKLFNNYYDVNFIDTDQKLRNSLAHDLDTPTVDGDKLTYPILNKQAEKEEKECNMLDILEELKGHPNKIFGV